MSWEKYDLVFRLRAPLHIGLRKSGNLQQTRGYVSGKVVWAALTARLTRDYVHRSTGQDYVETGNNLRDFFRFGYLYPATEDGDTFKTHYPWDEDFDYLFLNSYASTALDYCRKSAAERQLHETEFIAPRTRCNRPVFLKGSLYVRSGQLPDPLDKWTHVLDRLRFGGESGYGWGRVTRECCRPNGDCSGTAVVGNLEDDGRITAHLQAKNAVGVAGPIEPVIGWERNNDPKKAAWSLSEAAVICYAPGARADKGAKFTIGPNGIWQYP